MWRLPSENSTKPKTTTYFADCDVLEVSDLDLGMLKRSAQNDPAKRARLCLHHSHDDLVQEMIIAFCKGTYVRPHRHTDKSESFHIIEGDIDVVFFDDEGSIQKRVRMSPPGRGGTFVYRLSSPLWHTVVPLSSLVILHETTNGPFRSEDSEFAPWSPPEDAVEEVAVLLRRVEGCT